VNRQTPGIRAHDHPIVGQVQATESESSRLTPVGAQVEPPCLYLHADTCVGRECICFCLYLPAYVAWGVEHVPCLHVREVSGLLCRPGRAPGGVAGVEQEDREGRSEPAATEDREGRR